MNTIGIRKPISAQYRSAKMTVIRKMMQWIIAVMVYRKYAKKSFCLNGACNDVTICLLKTETGEDKYYLPLIGSLNKSKEMVYYFES